MNEKNSGNGKTGLIVLTVICIVLIAISVVGSSFVSPVSSVTGFVITPIQKGLNSLGTFLSGFSTNLTDSTTLREENAELREKVDSLTAENSKLVLDKEELERLQGLLELKEEYSEYDSVGARVISRGSGNWFNTFTIDKGTNDGISVNCNVMAGAGLVGIVTAVGPNWANVRAIIDDNSNVSAMISTTSDTCIIAGNLALIDEGTLSLVKLTDDNNHVHVGDKVVTSNISEKYLPGILIGYIAELNNDANNLTKSGTVTPVVDFRHLQEVLVIRTLKQYEIIDEDSASGISGSGTQTTLTAPRSQTSGDEAGSGEADAENGEGAENGEAAAEGTAATADADAGAPAGGEAAAEGTAATADADAGTPAGGEAEAAGDGNLGGAAEGE